LTVSNQEHCTPLRAYVLTKLLHCILLDQHHVLLLAYASMLHVSMDQSMGESQAEVCMTVRSVQGLQAMGTHALVGNMLEHKIACNVDDE
jgi:hypothetical protein